MVKIYIVVAVCLLFGLFTGHQAADPEPHQSERMVQDPTAQPGFEQPPGMGYGLLVAFTATSPIELTYDNDKLCVVYKEVVTNFGDAYNPYTGHFTAPFPGVYHFSFSFWRSGAMYLNGKEIVSVNTPNSYFPTYGSNSAALALQEGDIINICVWRGRGESGYHYSTFSGFLLHPFWIQ